MSDRARKRVPLCHPPARFPLFFRGKTVNELPAAPRRGYLNDDGSFGCVVSPSSSSSSNNNNINKCVLRPVYIYIYIYRLGVKYIDGKNLYKKNEWGRVVGWLVIYRWREQNEGGGGGYGEGGGLSHSYFSQTVLNLTVARTVL